MITKELIRQEIERRLKDYWKICFQDVKAYNEDSNVRELKELLTFLDTLSDESVTDCNDLKKHTKEWVELMVGASFPEQDGDFISEEDYRSVIRQTALHFAKWGADHLCDTTKKVSEDIEEAAKKYDEAESWRWEAPKYPRREAFEAGAEWQSKRYQETIETAEDHAFLAGSNWQKEQMMKNAVEGEVVKDISNKLAVTAKNINLDGFKFGDKVRVVIVKEDEK